MEIIVFCTYCDEPLEFTDEDFMSVIEIYTAECPNCTTLDRSNPCTH